MSEQPYGSPQPGGYQGMPLGTFAMGPPGGGKGGPGRGVVVGVVAVVVALVAGAAFYFTRGEVAAPAAPAAKKVPAGAKARPKAKPKADARPLTQRQARNLTLDWLKNLAIASEVYFTDSNGVYTSDINQLYRAGDLPRPPKEITLRIVSARDDYYCISARHIPTRQTVYYDTVSGAPSDRPCR